MHFPGGSNTRKNPLAYKYIGKKSTDFRLPRGLEDGSQRWNWRNVRCSVRLFCKLYEVLFVRSTNSTMLCSLAQQKWTFVLYVWSSTERGCDQYDQHKYDCSSNWWLKHPCYSDGPCIVYWKGTFLSQIISVLPTALILSYYCLWNA